MAVHYKEIFNSIMEAEMGPKGYFRKGGCFYRYIPDTHMYQTLLIEMGHSGRTMEFQLGTNHLYNPIQKSGNWISSRVDPFYAFYHSRSDREVRDLMLYMSPTAWLTGEDGAYSEENFIKAIHNHLSILKEYGIERRVLDITTDEEYYRYVNDYIPGHDLFIDPAFTLICYKTGRIEQAQETAETSLRWLKEFVETYDDQFSWAEKRNDKLYLEYLVDYKDKANFNIQALESFMEGDIGEFERLLQNQLSENHKLLQSYFGKKNPNRTAE